MSMFENQKRQKSFLSKLNFFDFLNVAHLENYTEPRKCAYYIPTLVIFLIRFHFCSVYKKSITNTIMKRANDDYGLIFNEPLREVYNGWQVESVDQAEKHAKNAEIREKMNLHD